MIIVKNDVTPRSVLLLAILGDIAKYRPTNNDHHILVLVPFIRDAAPLVVGNCVHAEQFRIALTSRVRAIDSVTKAALANDILNGFSHLPGSVRVPYTIFSYHDEFYTKHHQVLADGTATHALIQRIAMGQPH